MKSIYINDFQIHSNSADIGFVVHSIDGLEFPTLRTNHYDKPGEHGAIAANLLYGGRMIALTGTVFGETTTLFQQRRRDFAEAIAVERDEFGALVPVTLKLTTIDDIPLQVDCTIEQFVLKSKEMNGQEFLLQLFAPNPELLSQNLATTAILKGADGGIIYPIIYPAVYAANAGNVATITNNGTVETWPLVYLNGPLTNPTIFNETVGRYIELALVLDSGSQIIIDMRNRTIITDGITNVIGAKSEASLFWWLEKGENLIKLLTTSNLDTGNASVDYRDARIGI